MNENQEFIDKNKLDSLAEESGLAIAIVDANSRQVFVVNDNSICRNLNPSDKFSPKCAEFCGKAFEMAVEAGKSIGFECHAGLDCRAFPAQRSGKIIVVIVGRTFVKAENYRKATERAVAGDWSEFPPSQFFENILLTGSSGVLDKTAKQVECFLVESRAKDAPTGLTPERPIETKREPEAAVEIEPATGRSSKAVEDITNLVEKFNRELQLQPQITKRQTTTPRISEQTIVEPETTEPKVAEPQITEPQITESEIKQQERRTVEARAWRSFFGSLLKTSYVKACSSILKFLAGQYGFSALIWLEKRENRFENASTFGEMKNRKVRIGIPPDDERLIAASQNDMPLELGERAKGSEPGTSRMMNLFPIGVGGDISAAVAILDTIDDDVLKKQIARICHSIAPQLEILRLRSEVSRREGIANAVRRFGDSLKGIDADDFWLHLTQNSAEMLRAERASLLILDEKSGELEIKAMIGARRHLADNEAVGNRVAKIVLTKNEPVIISDVARTGLPPAPAGRKYKTSSFVSCPITVGSRTIGVMNFTDRAGGEVFDKSALELIQAIAPQLAVAIDRASLKEKAGEFEQLSVTDALTGLLNRRYIEERLMEEVKRSNRHGFPMSFMMLDVDQFKAYNDQFGHPAGDEALRLVAHVLKDTLRGADVAARFGGEEFSILLPQTNGEEAAAIAERIRCNIEEAGFLHRTVTISIGVASCSAELCASAELISAADKALYEAKRQGRNKVVIYEDLNGAPDGI